MGEIEDLILAMGNREGLSVQRAVEQRPKLSERVNMLKANQRELQIKENVTGDTVHVVEQEDNIWLQRRVEI